MTKQLRAGATWPLAVSLALAALAASAGPELFALSREALAVGQLWRLWSGHLVHASAAHFAFDVGALLCLCLFFRVRWELLWMPPLIALAIFACYPQLSSYYGLSGLMHGMAILFAGRFALQERGKFAMAAWGFALAVFCKSALETYTSSALFSNQLDMGAPVLHGSHLIGSLAGLCGLLWITVRKRIRSGRASRAPAALPCADGHPSHAALGGGSLDSRPGSGTGSLVG